jgi:hypothetical protein
MELTDGWYTIPAVLDEKMVNLIQSDRLKVGDKIHVQNSTLEGGSGPCPVLERPPSLKLKIHSNSVRKARRFQILGTQKLKSFSVCLKSISANGGTVGRCDVTVIRKYPTTFYEKMSNSKSKVRSCAEEDLAAKEWQIKFESEFERLALEYEKNPGSFEFDSTDSEFIKSQLMLIAQEVTPIRNVSQCLTIEVCDNPPPGCVPYDCSTVMMIQLWNFPPNEIDALEEGKSYRFHNLIPTKNLDESGKLRLRNTNKTVYRPLRTTTEEKFTHLRYLCKLETIANRHQDYIDLACVIIGIKVQENDITGKNVYHLLCTDESSKLAVVEVHSSTANQFSVFVPLLFLNLKKVYTCKRYQKLSATQYSIFSRTEISPFIRTTRLKELKEWIKNNVPEYEKKIQYHEQLLSEIRIGCIEENLQVRSEISEAEREGMIAPFHTIITNGASIIMGQAEDMLILPQITGIAFHYISNSRNHVISFTEDQLLLLLKILATPAEKESLAAIKADTSFYERRMRALNFFQISSLEQTILFYIQNGRIVKDTQNSSITVPFAESEWTLFVSLLCSCLSNRLFKVKTCIPLRENMCNIVENFTV